MERCEKYEALIAGLVHRGILPDEREELERHMAECARCAALCADVSALDRALRGIPGKLAEPPEHLRRKILAGLPEERKAEETGWWAMWGAGRWAALAGGLATCALALLLVFRGMPAKESRVASVPPVGPSAAAAPESAVTPAPAGEAAQRAPHREAATKGPAKSRAVASAPRVQVIKEVRIYFYYPPAQKVAVTGDFNGWNAEGVPLRPAGKPGLWVTDLKLRPGAYSYNFIVDGERLVPDPNSPAQAPDGFGGTNSIMLVKEDKPA